MDNFLSCCFIRVNPIRVCHKKIVEKRLGKPESCGTIHPWLGNNAGPQQKEKIMETTDTYTQTSIARAQARRQQAEAAFFAGTQNLEQVRLLAHYARPGTHGAAQWKEFGAYMRALGAVPGVAGDDDRRCWAWKGKNVAWAS